MPRASDWARRFGASRRAKDRKLLMEVEKAITTAELREIELEVEREERVRAKEEAETLQDKADSAHEQWLQDEERDRIARAFGRPN